MGCSTDGSKWRGGVVRSTGRKMVDTWVDDCVCGAPQDRAAMIN